MLEYLYSTPARPVYTRAVRAYRPFGRTVQNNNNIEQKEKKLI